MGDEVVLMEKLIKCVSPVAILMATYNGEEYIFEQIDSIIKQTFQDWEIFIHDDGSKDNTVNIIRHLIDIYPNKIHLLDGPSTGGAKNNFFYLMKKIDADYVMFSDQDDIWLNDKIEKTLIRMKKIEKNGSPCLVYTDLKVVDNNLNIISEKMSIYQNFNTEKKSVGEFLCDNNVTGCTVMINRKLKELATKVTNYEPIIMHDWWLALVAAEFGMISFVEDSTILYRQHGDNSVGAKKFNGKYILERLKNASDIRKRLIGTQKQALCFTNTYQLSKNNGIYKYAHINEFSKIDRINFYKRNGINKSGFIRNIGLLIFG